MAIIRRPGYFDAANRGCTDGGHPELVRVAALVWPQQVSRIALGGRAGNGQEPWNCRLSKKVAYSSLKACQMNPSWLEPTTQSGSRGVLFKQNSPALLYAKNLTEGFFNLSFGEAGAVLQKLRNYGVRLALVCPAGSVQVSRRFGEMVAEEQLRNHFGVFETRQAAREWLGVALNLGGALAATQRSPRGCHFSHRSGGVALERSPRLAIQSRKSSQDHPEQPDDRTF